MRKALVAICALALVVALTGCGNAEEKALETKAPPTKPGSKTYENGGQPKPIGERSGDSGPQMPAEKPPGY